MATGDLKELQVNGLVLGHRVQQTFGIQYLTNAATAAGLASDFLTNFQAGWLASMPSAYTLQNVRVVDVKPGTVATYELAATGTVVGSATGDLLPMQAALVLSLQTALKGRSYRGRIFLGPFVESQQANSQWASGFITGWQTAFLTPFVARYGPAQGSVDYMWVVLSRFNNGAKRVTPIGTQVTGQTLRSIVYSQRRRTLGTGS